MKKSIIINIIILSFYNSKKLDILFISAVFNATFNYHIPIFQVYKDLPISQEMRTSSDGFPKELINHATTAVCDSYLGARSLIDAFRPDRRVCYPRGTDTPVNHGNQETIRDSVLLCLSPAGGTCCQDPWDTDSFRKRGDPRLAEIVTASSVLPLLPPLPPAKR